MAGMFHGRTHLELITNLKERGVIRTDRVEQVMKAVDRRDFCTTSPYQDSSQRLDGFAVTISAPHVHAYALESLSSRLKEGGTVLDVGSGSGYLTACMALMVGNTGHVVGIDIIDGLKKVAEKNVSKKLKRLLDSSKVHFVCGDGIKGFKRAGPYDAIHVGATVQVVHEALLNQLKPGGRMFVPVASNGGAIELQQIDKLPNGKISKSLFQVTDFKVTLKKTENKIDEDYDDDIDDIPVPEQLRCPICFDVPLAEVYQCKNGHTICSECEANVTECPQCRIPIPVAGELIRNRALESMLDNIMVSCPNRQKGCKDKMLRKDVKNHLLTCIQSNRSIQLCKTLFPNDSCNFWTNALTSLTSLNHFVSSHKGVLVKGSSVSIKIDNINVVANHIPSDGLWEPVLLTSRGREHFMILTFFNKIDKSISWTCLNLDSCNENDEKYEVEYVVQSLSKTAPQLKWKCPPLSVTNCVPLISDPMFWMPISTLEKYYMEPGGSNLKLLVNIKTSSGVHTTERVESVMIGSISYR